MWLWNSRQPTPLRPSSVRAAQPTQRRKVLKKPVEYYEEAEDNYDEYDDEEQY